MPAVGSPAEGNSSTGHFWGGSDDEWPDDGTTPARKSERERRRSRLMEAIGLLRRRRVLPSTHVDVCTGLLPKDRDSASELDKGANLVPDLDVNDDVALARMAAQRLADPAPQVRLAALEVLVRAPTILAEEAANVAHRLEDDAWFVRRAAVAALARLNPPAKQAIDYFLPRLGDAQEEVRTSALQRLARVELTVLQDFAGGSIARATRDGYSPARVAALSILGCMDRTTLDAHGGTRLAADRLDDPAANVRVAAVDALREWGLQAVSEYRPRIEHLAQHDAENEVRHAADRAVRSLEDELEMQPDAYV